MCTCFRFGASFWVDRLLLPYFIVGTALLCTSFVSTVQANEPNLCEGVTCTGCLKCVEGVCVADDASCDDDDPCNGAETCNTSTGDCEGPSPAWECDTDSCCDENACEVCDASHECIDKCEDLPCEACDGEGDCKGPCSASIERSPIPIGGGMDTTGCLGDTLWYFAEIENTADEGCTQTFNYKVVVDSGGSVIGKNDGDELMSGSVELEPGDSYLDVFSVTLTALADPDSTATFRLLVWEDGGSAEDPNCEATGDVGVDVATVCVAGTAGGCPGQTVPLPMRIVNTSECKYTYDWTLTNIFQTVPLMTITITPSSGSVIVAAGGTGQPEVNVQIGEDTEAGTVYLLLEVKVSGVRVCVDTDGRVSVGTSGTSPADCSDCAGTNSLSVDEVGAADECADSEQADACGVTVSPSASTQQLTFDACFSGCVIEFRVDATRDMPSNPCFNNFTNVTGGGEPVTLGNYCDIVKIFKGKAGGASGCGSHDGTVYAASSCVEMHEDSHLEDFREVLGDEAARLVIEPVPVSGDPPEPSCADAKADHDDEVTNAVNQAYARARARWLPNESKAEAAARQCNCQTADAICEWAAAQQGAPACGSCPVNCD